MKPQSIVWFDRLFWLGVVLAVATMALNLSHLLDIGGEDPRRTILALASVAGFVLVMGIYVCLWFFISRQASNTARYAFAIIMAIIFVINIVGLPSGNASALMTSAAIDIVRFAVWVVSAGLLFVGGSPEWFRQAADADDDGLA